MALADRFEGYSKVFASESAFGIDLKAMADTLREMPEDKFAKVINAGFEEDKEAMLTTPGRQITQPTLHGGRPDVSPTPGGIVPTDPMFKGVPKGLKAKMISNIAKKRKIDPSMVQSIYEDFQVAAKEASSEEVDAGLVTPGHQVGQPTLPSSRKDPVHTPGGIVSTDPMFKEVPKGLKAKMISDIAKKRKIDPSMVQSIYEDFQVAAKEASEEVDACGKKEASESAWTKEAFDYVAQSLVRDVLGMEKSICCDTKRHLDKVQMPDAKKSPETKGAVARAEDTGAALKPEQVPDLSEVLESDMYKKSKGAVRKEAAVEETPDAKAAEPQDVKDAGKVKDPAVEIEKMKKEKAKEELKEKSRPKAEAPKEAEVVEANTIVAEGIEFDGVLNEVDASDEDVKKLSALFE